MIRVFKEVLNGKNLREHCLTFVFYFLAVLFAASLLKNISYPLLWADESMTVMHGQRVLEYGYPKVHDGKNVLYDLRHWNPKLGIDEKTDAYIGGANWGMYYFAAIAVAMARITDDFYTKTAILRIPFAIAGLAGLAILAFLGAQFFDNRLSQCGFLTLFAFLELMSIPLILHLREARYYSLTVFLTALVVFVYARHRILERGRYSTYVILLTLSLFCLFITFSPAYFIFLTAIVLYESIGVTRDLISHIRKKTGRVSHGMSVSRNTPFRYHLQLLLPVLLSLIAVSPLLSFFKTFYIAEEVAKFNRLLFRVSEWQMYQANLEFIWNYFTRSDLIYLGIVLKFCVLISLKGLSVRDFSVPDTRKLEFSNFLTVIFVVYFLAIARIPNFPYTRYFVPLQPILAAMVILDVALVYNRISVSPALKIRYGKVMLLIVFAGLVLFNIGKNSEHLKGHAYELFHQYKGPLDYLIPFIRETYRDTGELVIATNYEETSFMYYLNSKVVMGFVGNNLEEDTQEVPDVIVYRKGWGNLHRRAFLDFFARHRYQRVSFPVFDSQVNNIPELNLLPAGPRHQFRTLYAGDELRRVDIYLKR